LEEGEVRKPGTKTKEVKSGSLVQRGKVRETLNVSEKPCTEKEKSERILYSIVRTM
jgi:hypothetical protein